MSEPSQNLAARFDALQSRVDELAGQLQQTKQDAVTARVLAGGADRDVEQVRGEIRDFRRATVASFNAMRDDLVDLRVSVGDGFVRVDEGFASVNDGFTEMRGRLDATAAGLAHITALLNTLVAERGDDADGPP